MFRNEKAGIFTFRVGQWSYFADLTVATSGRCQIRMSLSSFLQCNGTWAPLPLTGIYIISISGDDHYLQVHVTIVVVIIIIVLVFLSVQILRFLTKVRSAFVSFTSFKLFVE